MITPTSLEIRALHCSQLLYVNSLETPLTGRMFGNVCDALAKYTTNHREVFKASRQNNMTHGHGKAFVHFHVSWWAVGVV